MHRTADLLRGHKQRDIFRIGGGFQTECAADILGDDAQLLLRPIHDAENVLAHGAGALRAGAQCVSVARGVVTCGATARLHGSDAEALIHFRNAATNLAEAKMRSTSAALASGSAAGPGQSMARLLGASGHRSGAPGCNAARASVTGVIGS